jgi:tryptophan 2,3-dioxygenase
LPRTIIAGMNRLLTEWRAHPDPDAFPYDAIVAEYLRVGKHSVARELLTDLGRIRDELGEGSGPAHTRLARFLDTALDKFDERYDNPSYLALEQLGLPGADGCPDTGHAQRRRDRQLVLLIVDMMRFELAAAHGCIDLLPEMRPERRVAAKRCRHGLRAIRPALERLGLDAGFDDADPLAAARQVCRAVWADATAEERRTLQLTAIPVSLVHDEYMFIRALQSYEVTFALIGVQLTASVAALERGDALAAAEEIAAADQMMRESSPLWSLVATMQTESFLRFREFTDGASAIQSRSYKRVESLCRRPDTERIDSPAYRSVPEVRERVLAGQPNIDDALVAASLCPGETATVTAAMERFEEAILRWRKTHYRLAVRMLGERPGTGYTEGVPYLNRGREIPVFERRCPFGHGAQRESPTAEEAIPA